MGLSIAQQSQVYPRLLFVTINWSKLNAQEIQENVETRKNIPGKQCIYWLDRNDGWPGISGKN
jgi:hypothetical protein